MFIESMNMNKCFFYPQHLMLFAALLEMPYSLPAAYLQCKEILIVPSAKGLFSDCSRCSFLTIFYAKYPLSVRYPAYKTSARMANLNSTTRHQQALELAPLLLCTEPDCYYMVFKTPGTMDCTLCDFTHVDQASWSARNLPAIFYEHDPTANVQANVPPIWTSAKVFGNSIRHFPVLPWHISSKVEGWRLEAWFRTDSRITPYDIMDRIHPDYKHEVSVEILCQRRESFLYQFHSNHWEPPLDEAPMAYQTVRNDGVRRYDRNEILNYTSGLTGNSNFNQENGSVLPPIADPFRNVAQLGQQVVQTDGPPPVANLYSNRLVPPRDSYYRQRTLLPLRTSGIRILNNEDIESRELSLLLPNTSDENQG
ncbi:uncharacterized protein APUU_20571S [Aspergillus puulaauensis]|uniref:Uncharacterized protein n=1 Tax=Aspergillus puulaauensis TaxID=1220207 RepID=A0A7R8AHY8_9EURO|nr:uncharacterized protein APUU_20571S [Aspergillus puulaauensis]BCS20139.1 hypothetical protein APUU_20571S [Aspergillus puulaauensis]